LEREGRHRQTNVENKRREPVERREREDPIKFQQRSEIKKRFFITSAAGLAQSPKTSFNHFLRRCCFCPLNLFKKIHEHPIQAIHSQTEQYVQLKKFGTTSSFSLHSFPYFCLCFCFFSQCISIYFHLSISVSAWLFYPEPLFSQTTFYYSSVETAIIKIKM
jgi:hypothetical protein